MRVCEQENWYKNAIISANFCQFGFGAKQIKVSGKNFKATFYNIQ